MPTPREMYSTRSSLQFTFGHNRTRQPGRSVRKRARPTRSERMKRPLLASPAGPPGATKRAGAELPRTDLRYWRSRLVHRNYLDLIDPRAARQYSARIGYGGTSCYFPLGAEDETRAAAQALEIHRAV